MKQLAVVTAAMTLALILAGGFVTTTRTGDTIDTWPHWWGSLPSGAWVEGTHRIAAVLVGLLTAALLVAAWRRPSPPWLRTLVTVAAIAVIVQAALGGVRVHRFFPTATAIVHATFAQVIFCAMTALALLLSRAWTQLPPTEDARAARALGAATTGAAFLQLVAGAVTRHTGAGLAVHLAGAGLVLLLVSLFASRLMLTPLKGGARALLAVLGVQVALGIATWAITAAGFARSHEAPFFQIVTVTAHVAGGAVLLGTSFILTLMCHRPLPAVELAAA